MLYHFLYACENEVDILQMVDLGVTRGVCAPGVTDPRSGLSRPILLHVLFEWTSLGIAVAELTQSPFSHTQLHSTAVKAGFQSATSVCNTEDRLHAMDCTIW